MELRLHINASDISEFSGYRHGANHNSELDAYIDIFVQNNDMRLFEIEDTSRSGNTLGLDTLCYISDRIFGYFPDVPFGMWVKAKKDDKGNIVSRVAGFYKED